MSQIIRLFNKQLRHEHIIFCLLKNVENLKKMFILTKFITLERQRLESKDFNLCGQLKTIFQNVD